MTRLEWCRANAPDTYADYSDEDLLRAMFESSKEFENEFEPDEEDQNNVELRPINNYLDEMVHVLVSVFGTKLAFKGGYMLTKLMPDSARQTTDIDFSIQSSETYQDLIATMKRIGDKFIELGYIERYAIKDAIYPKISGGMDMYNSKGEKVLGIDIGWHDISFGTTTVTIDNHTIRCFEIERMLADKVCAILSRKRFRRPKDLYDVYCITNCFDFNAKKVNEYILLRTEGAGADWQNYPFNAKVRTEYKKCYDSLHVTSIRLDKELEKPSFEDVMDRFNVICGALIGDYDITWNHTLSRF